MSRRAYKTGFLGSEDRLVHRTLCLYFLTLFAALAHADPEEDSQLQRRREGYQALVEAGGEKIPDACQQSLAAIVAHATSGPSAFAQPVKWNYRLGLNQQFIPPSLRLATPGGGERKAPPHPLTEENFRREYTHGYYFRPTQIAIEPVRRAAEATGRIMWKHSETKSVLGSGFLVSDHGDILTAYHCIQGMDKNGTLDPKSLATATIEIRGEKVPLEDMVLVKKDFERDIALLRIPQLAGRPHLSVVEEGTVKDIYWEKTGVEVPIAAAGFYSRRSTPLVSVGTMTPIEHYSPGHFLMSILVELGWSGGPVVLMDGRVIGISVGGSDHETGKPFHLFQSGSAAMIPNGFLSK